jgi:hypothetical protein
MGFSLISQLNEALLALVLRQTPGSWALDETRGIETKVEMQSSARADMHAPQLPTSTIILPLLLLAKFRAQVTKPRSNDTRVWALELGNGTYTGVRHIRFTSHILSYWRAKKVEAFQLQGAWGPAVPRHGSDSLQKMQARIS